MTPDFIAICHEERMRIEREKSALLYGPRGVAGAAPNGRVPVPRAIVKFKLVPNKPEPLSAVQAAFSDDARWRNVPSTVNSINIVERMDLDRAKGDLR